MKVESFDDDGSRFLIGILKKSTRAQKGTDRKWSKSPEKICWSICGSFHPHRCDWRCLWRLYRELGTHVSRVPRSSDRAGKLEANWKVFWQSAALSGVYPLEAPENAGIAETGRVIGLFDDLTVCTPLPRYLPFPKFLLDAQLSHTAKLLYALLLDRATLSRKNNWTDEQDRIYVIYPIPKLAQALGCSFSSVTRSLTELTDAGLIERIRSGFSKPSRIFLKIPHTAQNRSVTLCISDSPDHAKMTNMIVQKCTPNYLNKNNLSFNHPTEQRNIPLYEFREGESLWQPARLF